MADLTHVERLLRQLEQKIAASTSWEEESRYRTLQSGATAALGAMHMDERQERREVPPSREVLERRLKDVNASMEFLQTSITRIGALTERSRPASFNDLDRLILKICDDTLQIVTARNAISEIPAVLCEHANECPSVCRCLPNCYCRRVGSAPSCQPR